MERAAASVRFCAASDQSLLVYLGDRIALGTHLRVRKLLRLLQLEPIAGVRNLHPAYSSVLVKFDPLRIEQRDLESVLAGYLARLEEIPLPEPRHIEIPVCYEGEFAPDLEEVAALHGLTLDEVTTLHSSAVYTVYFLGFLPGFAYLGGLPQNLATSRLAQPRRNVPCGSVGIAGHQTGIYPFSTPGGWRLIGRTPSALFVPQREQMSVLEIGDQVRFVPISSRRFAELDAPCA